MNSHPIMEYDGGFTSIATYYSTGGADSSNLAWRFITTEENVVIANPLNIHMCEDLSCIPNRICSILTGRRGELNDLIIMAHGLITACKALPSEPDYVAIREQISDQISTAARDEWNRYKVNVRKAAEAEDAAEWDEEFQEHLQDQAEELCSEDLERSSADRKGEIVQQYIDSISAEERERRLRIFIYDNLMEEAKDKWIDIQSEAKQEADELNNKCRIEYEETRKKQKQLREQFFKELSLYEINEFIGRHTGRKPVPVNKPGEHGYSDKDRKAIVESLSDPDDEGASILIKIREFIVYELFRNPIGDLLNTEEVERKPSLPPGGFAAPTIRHKDYRKLLDFIQGTIDEDITLPLIKSSSNQMVEYFPAWVESISVKNEMSFEEGEEYIANHVRYVAEIEGRNSVALYPVIDLSPEPEVMNKDDVELYQSLSARTQRRENDNLQDDFLGTKAQLTSLDDKRKAPVESYLLNSKPAVTFMNDFTYVSCPFDLELQLTKRICDKILSRLFENWRNNSNQPIEWNIFTRDFNIKENCPRRFFEDRRACGNSDKKRVLHEIIKPKTYYSGDSLYYTICLDDKYTYKASK